MTVIEKPPSAMNFISTLDHVSSQFLQVEKVCPKNFNYLTISYLLNIPLNVFQTADTGHTRQLFQTSYQDMEKYKK